MVTNEAAASDGLLVKWDGERYKKGTQSNAVPNHKWGKGVGMDSSGSNRVEGSSPIVTGILLFAVLVPAIAAFAILWTRAYAAPFQDDYHAVLEFGGDCAQLNSVKDKVRLVASALHTEYKLVFEHAVIAADLVLTRRIDFSFLQLAGDVFLLPIGWLLWLVYGERKCGVRARLVRFLPVSLIFFGLAYWETLNWAMAGLQNLPVVFFSLLSIYLLAGRDGFVVQPMDRRRVESLGFPPLAQEQERAKDGAPQGCGWACVAGALAAFSSANGFLVAVVGAWILLRKRAYWAGVGWGASFVIPLAAYLYHYVKVPRQVSGLYYVARPLEVFAFLGMAVGSFWGALMAGFAIAAVVVWALRAGYVRENPVGVYWTIWILLSALPVAWVRGSTGVVIASRYSIYSCLMLVFCYAFLADRATAKGREAAPGHGWARVFYPAALVAATAFCVVKDVEAYEKLGARSEMIRAGMEHYRQNPEVNSPLIDAFVIKDVPGEEQYERQELTRAIESGIYREQAIGNRQ